MFLSLTEAKTMGYYPTTGTLTIEAPPPRATPRQTPVKRAVARRFGNRHHFSESPFGEVLSATGSQAAGNPWRFSSKYFDPDTGLGYWGFRWYDAKNGRWLGREPLGEGESANLFAYCGNDGANLWDYLGLDPKTAAEAKKGLDDPLVEDDAKRKCRKSEIKPVEARIEIYTDKTLVDQALEAGKSRGLGKAELIALYKSGNVSEVQKLITDVGHAFLWFPSFNKGFGIQDPGFVNNGRFDPSKLNPAQVREHKPEEPWTHHSVFNCCPDTYGKITTMVNADRKKQPLYKLDDESRTRDEANCTTWVLEILAYSGVISFKQVVIDPHEAVKIPELHFEKNPAKKPSNP
jgi:RHS repeat-associated protein